MSVIKRQTSILNNAPAGQTPTKQTALHAAPKFSNELHPLPPVHLTQDDVRPDRLIKTLMDLHESIRQATVSMRQDPESAPSYVRNVLFTNNTANSAPVTVIFRHGLGRNHTSLHACRSRNAAYAGYEAPLPEGYDPTQYAAVTAQVPPNTTAIHDFKLAGD
jgi:hypothetical protein